jgi:ribulose 1,5-bisphosphate synthetase/thiazole synthase
MYLNQALTKIRNLKSKLSRTEKVINGVVVQYEDAEPEYSYVEEVASRSKLVDEVRDLRAKVLRTNAVTRVVWNKQDITLAELILVNADLRSEMAFVTGLLEKTTVEESGWRSSTRTKDDIKKVFAEGYSKAELRAKLELLEQTKESMDGLMQEVNASTKLVTD